MTFPPDWYAARRERARSSATAVVPWLRELVAPSSVVDVGCGTGSWLASFQEEGVRDVLGVDGSHVAQAGLEIPVELFRAHDLTQPLELDRRFDLTLCVEVGEHLPATAADTLVESLTRAAPCVVFSAAIPHQGGHDHMNEQWPDYWKQKFEARQFQVVDCFRARFWDDDRVRYFYAQNLFLYVARDRLDAYPEIRRQLDNNSAMPLRVVHPKLYGAAVERFPPPRSGSVAQLARYLLRSALGSRSARVESAVKRFTRRDRSRRSPSP
jgi:SAM-dependent methyltransferase